MSGGFHQTAREAEQAVVPGPTPVRHDPGGATAGVLALQRLVGNRAVSSLLVQRGKNGNSDSDSDSDSDSGGGGDTGIDSVEKLIDQHRATVYAAAGGKATGEAFSVLKQLVDLLRACQTNENTAPKCAEIAKALTPVVVTRATIDATAVAILNAEATAPNVVDSIRAATTDRNNQVAEYHEAEQKLEVLREESANSEKASEEERTTLDVQIESLTRQVAALKTQLRSTFHRLRDPVVAHLKWEADLAAKGKALSAHQSDEKKLVDNVMKLLEELRKNGRGPVGLKERFNAPEVWATYKAPGAVNSLEKKANDIVTTPRYAPADPGDFETWFATVTTAKAKRKEDAAKKRPKEEVTEIAKFMFKEKKVESEKKEEKQREEATSSPPIKPAPSKPAPSELQKERPLKKRERGVLTGIEATKKRRGFASTGPQKAMETLPVPQASTAGSWDLIHQVKAGARQLPGESSTTTDSDEDERSTDSDEDEQ